MENTEIEKILDRFKSGCNCAHAVLLAFRENTGLDEKTVMGLGMGFGAGIARTGHVCGAVNGGVMTLGMVCTKAMEDPSDAKELTIEVVQHFLEDFKEANGSVYCSELLDGLDLRTPEGREVFQQTGLHEKVCEPAVRSAIDSVGKLIELVISDK
ncbi:MAG: C-GCAxxG-C-C family protein [Bacteroidota bacterium]